MSNKTVVSVIIPVYNRLPMMKEAIQSVLDQTYPHFEVVVVDDGSTENIREAVESFGDSRIRYLHKENSGRPAPARNVGIKNAEGKFIAFLDTDDLWFPEKLDLQIQALESNPQILAVGTNMCYDLSRQPRIGFDTEQVLGFRALLENSNPIANSSVMFRSELAEKIGYLDESANVMEDIDYWLRILKFRDHSILFLPQVLTLIRMHDNNLSGGFDFNESYYDRIENTYVKHEDIDPEFMQSFIRKYRYRKHLSRQTHRLKQREIGISDILKDKRLTLTARLKMIVKRMIGKI